ncbi:polysaccharide biosynthesis tyrosine autokinase [Cognatishimia sp. MH4019]|uniref:GumC family protein n=1 Tax=Cognatishimia sp. MH4019 TaxID=2854030 RepID=UPI001CD554D2
MNTEKTGFNRRPNRPAATILSRSGPEIGAMMNPLGILRRYYWVVVLVTAAFFGLGYMLTANGGKDYTAHSTIVLRPESATVEMASVPGGLELTETTVETQLDILKSRQVLGSVVERLELDRDARFAGAALAAGDTFQARDNAISVIANNTRVERRANSLALQVSTVAPDPALAAQISNTLAQAYLDDRRESRLAEIEASVEVLETREQVIGQRLSEAKSELARHVRDMRLDDTAVGPRLQAEIERLNARLELPLEGADTSTAELEARIEQLKQAQVTRSIAEFRRDELERELETNGVIYDQIVSEIAQLDTRTRTLRPAAFVASVAEPPLNPSSMSPKTGGALSAIGGGLLAIFGLIVAALFDTRIKTTQQIEQELEVSNLGVIPIPTLSRKLVQDIPPFEFFSAHPQSPFSDAVRRLFFNLDSALGGLSGHAIALTSTTPNEGKTSLSTCLAMAAAQMNVKVALVDLDSRKQSIAEYVVDHDPRLESVPSLKDWFAGETRLNRVLVQSPVFDGVDLFLWPAERSEEATVLKEERLRALMGTLREKYDLVVIDTPPILLVSDISHLGRHIDGYLIVAGWEMITQSMLGDLRKVLSLAGGPIIGSVLNRVDAKKQHQLGTYDHLYYHQYEHYYDTDAPASQSTRARILGSLNRSKARQS